MRRTAFTLKECVLVCAVLAAATMILWPPGVPGHSRENARRSSCQSNLKQIGRAFAQYARDSDDKLPLVSTPQGWFGVLQPYVKTPQIFQCASENDGDNLTDYWFNRRLAGLETTVVADATSTLLSGDGEPSDDPNVSLQMLPPLWITREDSPVRRHLETGNYLFADGHTKAIKPQRVVTPETDGIRPTFLAR